MRRTNLTLFVSKFLFIEEKPFYTNIAMACSQGRDCSGVSLMRRIYLVMASCLALTACSQTAQQKFTRDLPAHHTVLPYSKQTLSVSGGCFPTRLLGVLSHIKRKTGRQPILTSGHRHGGKTGSYHRKCMAADIRIPGMSDQAIIAVARTAPGVGGIGRYCNGIVHVDVGPKRTWSHCGKRSRRG